MGTKKGKSHPRNLGMASLLSRFLGSGKISKSINLFDQNLNVSPVPDLTSSQFQLSFNARNKSSQLEQVKPPAPACKPEKTGKVQVYLGLDLQACKPA